MLDALTREIVGRPDHPLRRAAEIHIVPVVDIDGLHQGIHALLSPLPKDHPRHMNINRDWPVGQWPETRAIKAFLARQASLGKTYKLALDLHNGWWRLTHSAACYTRACPDEATADYRQRQTAFIDWMYAHTDHEKPGHHWEHSSGGLTFASWFPTAFPQAIAHTVEFSRHIWWSRAREAYEEFDPAFIPRLARQWAECLPASPALQ